MCGLHLGQSIALQINDIDFNDNLIEKNMIKLILWSIKVFKDAKNYIPLRL